MSAHSANRVESNREGNAVASSPTRRPQLPTARPPGAPAGGPTPFWRKRGFWIYLVVLLLLNYVISIVFTGGPSRMTVPYTTFIEQVNSNNVKDITAQSNSIQGDFKASVTYGSASGTLFQTERPVFAQDNLEALLQQHNVTVAATPPGSGQSPLLNLLLSFGPALLLIGGFLYLSRRMQTAGPGGILDAFGRSRASSATFGANDEREQTLNQILTEMDGFTPNQNVVVLAATNRPEVLDPALLRPGRFDRRVTVSPPDRAGREAILKIHTRNLRLAPDVNLGEIAGATAGFVGADLRNIANEAALLAAQKGEDLVTQADFDEAIERSVLGLRRPIVLGHDEQRLIAYHESGHALMGLLVPGADPVKKLTIVPRGLSLGSTYSQPIDDRYNYPESYLRGRITLALGGRAAEEVAYGAVTTGAESDLQQVNQIARSMVARFGMSPKLGPLNLIQPGDGAVAQHFSEETSRLLDEEVRRIVDECHRDSVRILTENRDRLDRLAEAVLKKDTLDQDEIYAAAGISPPPSSHPTIAPPPPVNGSSRDRDLAKDEVGSEIHR